MSRVATALALWLVCLAAAAGDALEVVELRHRTAAELLPVLRPLAAERSAITGTGRQLVIRAPEDEIARLREVIERLDRAPRRFRIAVSQGFEAATERHRSDARVRLGAGPGGVDGDVHVRSLATRGRDDRRVDAFVQALEGRPALVRTARSVPLADRTLLLGPGGPVAIDSVRYRDLDSGFWVVVHPAAGDEVTLDVYPLDQRPDAERPGEITTHAVATTVRARLGEWVPLAGTQQRRGTDETALGAHTRRRGARDTAVWLRVEAVP